MVVSLHEVKEDFVFFRNSQQDIQLEVFLQRLLRQLWFLTLELIKGKSEIFNFLQNACPRSNHGLSTELDLIQFEEQQSTG